jgi:hypothetical protein
VTAQHRCLASGNTPVVPPELVTVILESVFGKTSPRCVHADCTAHAAASAVVAAGFHQRRTITTDEGLAALPDSAVVRDNEGGVHIAYDWGNPYTLPLARVRLPALVLWEPTR